MPSAEPRLRLLPPTPGPSRPLPLDPDPDQRAAVAHAGGPLLVLGGPGTGKTTVLQECVAARVEAGVDPARLLVLTLDRHGADELRQALALRLGTALRRPIAQSFPAFAFSLLARFAAASGKPEPRLLTGAEQDLLVRDLLLGELHRDGGQNWPNGLRAALTTRRFAGQLREFLHRCVEQGLSPQVLDRWGREHGREEWRAAAHFLDSYRNVIALTAPDAFDPSELVRVAARLLEPVVDGTPVRGGGLSADVFDWVFVDDYQDADPARELLLSRLVPESGNVVAFADPDSSIHGFRGSDPRGVRRFADLVPTRSARTVELRTSHRCAAAIVSLAGRVSIPLPFGARRPELPSNATGGRDSGGDSGLPASPTAGPVAGRIAGRVAGRSARRSAGHGLGWDEVEILLAGSRSREAEVIATLLRGAHVFEEIPWEEMAVVVRSARLSLPILRRVLPAAGVPIIEAAPDIALADLPGLRPLFLLLEAALRPDTLDEARAAGLLTSSLGAADPISLSRLRCQLAEGAAGLDAAAGGGPGREGMAENRTRGVLRTALADPGQLSAIPPALCEPVKRIARLLDRAKEAAAAPGATPESVLWAVWSASGLGAKWQRASLTGGAAAADADRHLDAAMAMFEAARSLGDRSPQTGPDALLDSVARFEVRADHLAPATAPRPGVRLLTAHAAKRLECDVIVVAGLQEDVWPNLRPRNLLLGTDDLLSLVETGKILPTGSARSLLGEERRLLRVAVSRARRRVVVTAVADPENGILPSRLLNDVPLPADDGKRVLTRPDEEAAGRDLGELRRGQPIERLLPRLEEISEDESQPPSTRRRAGTLSAFLREASTPFGSATLVADLRRTASDPASAPDVREAAVRHLAVLAERCVPGADPDEWYAVRPLSDARPLRADGESVTISPSRLDQFARCELRWLLESISGSGSASTAQAVGNLVHEIAALMADPAYRSREALLDELEKRWDDVKPDIPWYAEQQRKRAREMAEKLLQWADASPRRLLATEEPFLLDIPVSLPDGRELTACLKGRVDRLEQDERGSTHVVDVKTGSVKPTDADVRRDLQLGVYQLATEAGAFPRIEGSGSAGASLVHVGRAAGRRFREQVQPPLDRADDPDWVLTRVREIAGGMSGSSFRAVPNELCDRCPVRTSCPASPSGGQVVGL